MDADSQAIGGGGGRSGGVPNYKNDILIEVVELYLPQGLEAWRAVALAYQRESMETVLRRGEDLRDNWNKKLCNCMQKPTGKTLRLSVAFRMKPPRSFWVRSQRSPLTLVTMARALSHTLQRRICSSGMMVMRRMKRWWQ